jgi:hypothetical protein
MPRLPDATDLTGSAIAPARSFVNLPSIDIAGAANALAQGVGQVGTSIEAVRKDREEKFRKQERFDTKMNLLKAEEIFAEQTRDLDPLDPAYVEKKKAVRRDVFGPVLSNVKDPENRMFFDESTGVDYANISIKAADEHQAARGEKTRLDLATYVDGQRKRIYEGADPDQVYRETEQMIDDADLDEIEKIELRQKLLPVIDADTIETRALSGATGAQLEDVLAQVKSDPSYIRLGVDEQKKVVAAVTSKFEKADKEAKAAAKIQLQRDTVEYAVQEFDDPTEAEAFIKASIDDPDTREDALTLFRKEQDQMAENERRRVEQNTITAWDETIAALDAGETAEALKIARSADIPPKERDALLERINKGRAVADNPEIYDALQAERLTSPDKFAARNLVELQGDLKPATIDALAKQQEDIKKKMTDTGKVVSLETPAAMLDQRLRELEIDISTKASTSDLRTAREIRSIMSQNLDTATRQKGSDLTPGEIEEVMDATFMQFRGKSAGWFRTTEENFTLKDVTDKFTEEEQRLEMIDGALINEALADFRDNGLDVTPAYLNEWLKRRIDGAAR